MQRRRFLAAGIALMGTTGCAAAGGADLLHTWDVTSFDARQAPVLAGRPCDLVFEKDGMARGWAAVSYMNAEYHWATGGRLWFTNVGGTAIGPGPVFAEQERLYYDAIRRTEGYSLGNSSLDLLDGSGVVLLSAKRR